MGCDWGLHPRGVNGAPPEDVIGACILGVWLNILGDILEPAS